LVTAIKLAKGSGRPVI
jgi:hypothetical protein